MQKVILSLDTDHIKRYVFATGTLKEIRGASAALDELNRIKMVELMNEIDASAVNIFANGGAGMFIMDDKQKALEYIEKIQKLYCRGTLTASVSAAMKSFDDEDGKGFNEAFNTLMYRLKHVKNQKGGYFQPVTHSFLRPCDSCGDEYAQYYEEDNEQPNKKDKNVICGSCFVKREKDKRIKSLIKDSLSGAKKRIPPTDEIWNWLLREMVVDPEYFVQNMKRPEEFTDIGELSSPSGYMGLIYADGNDMGKRFESLKTPEEVKSFSKVIDDAVRNAVLKGVKKHLKPVGNTLPFDILMLGGDDLVMVTSADKVIETAIAVAEEFRSYTGSEFKKFGLGAPVDLSIGVVIAHAKFPFGVLLSLAEDLLKFAKKHGDRKANKTGPTDTSMINFQVISASSSLNFTEHYTKNLSFKERMLNQEKKYHRTMRPYTVKKMKEVLLPNIKKVKQLPKNKIQKLREAAFRDSNNSILEFLSAFNRLNDEKRKLLKSICRDFSTNGEDEEFFWFRDADEFYTPFLDIAELYGFVQGGEDDKN